MWVFTVVGGTPTFCYIISAAAGPWLLIRQVHLLPLNSVGTMLTLLRYLSRVWQMKDLWPKSVADIHFPGRVFTQMIDEYMGLVSPSVPLSYHRLPSLQLASMHRSWPSVFHSSRAATWPLWVPMLQHSNTLTHHIWPSVFHSSRAATWPLWVPMLQHSFTMSSLKTLSELLVF